MKSSSYEKSQLAAPVSTVSTAVVTTLDGTLLTAWSALAASGHPDRGHRLLAGVIAVAQFIPPG